MISLNPKNTLPLLFIICLLFSGCEDSISSDENASPEFNHTQAPGTSVDAFLNDSRFTELVVEVDYMPGHQPTAGALDSLAAFFSQQLTKSTITINEPTQIPSDQKPAYLNEDLKELENQHRSDSTQTDSNVLHAYILIVDGDYADLSVTLSTAYYNTSIALFGSAISNINTDPRTPSKLKIEATVMEHAFGHILGLVGNGTPDVSIDGHQTGNTHCTVDGCLMAAPVGITNFYRFGFEQNIPKLDSLCIDDLQVLRDE